MLFRKWWLFTENHTKHRNIFCGDIDEIFNLKAGDIEGYHCALKGLYMEKE
jgi:hypothetical protein